jgi:hypothetical protein
MTEQNASDADLAKAVERFGLAVSELALGHGGLRERIRDAWTHLLAVQAHDIPAGVRDQFREMESVWLFSDASLLSDDEAEDAARSILLMEAELLTLLGSHARDSAPRVDREQQAAMPGVESLAASVEPLRAWFNDHIAEPRFIAILSAT